jgi:predicted Zn-dependent protease
LRPSFYSPEVPERALSNVFMREIGHALGLFGKSDRLGDLMYEAAGKSSNKTASIAQRDVNTLKRVYEGPALPDTLTLETPLEWATSY